MAIITNPRKSFQFSIFVAGMNPFLAQEVESPDVETEIVLHGDTNFDVKTGGRIKYGLLKVKKIATAYGPDNFFWDWHTQVMNVFTGGGFPPPVYWRSISVIEFAIDGITPINSETYLNCWPHKRAGKNWKRTASENTMEDIEFAVERIRPA